MAVRADVDNMIDFLNSLLEIDHEAITQLVNNRVYCNDSMVAHPTVQTAGNKVGLLGILNGYFGAFDSGEYAGWGAITCTIEPSGIISKFTHTGNN